MSKYSIIVLLVITGTQAWALRAITVGGGTATVPHLAERAPGFGREHEVGISLGHGGSSQGYECIKNQSCDLSVITMLPKDAELGRVQKILVGYDAVALVVNLGVKVDSLTTEQARDIFNGKIKNWREIGGPDLPVRALQRGKSYGSREMIDAILKIDSKAEELATSQAVLNKVKAVEGAISYVGTSGALEKDGKSLRIMKLDGAFPSAAEIKSGSYILRREVFVLRNQKPQKDPILDALIELIRGSF